MLDDMVFGDTGVYEEQLVHEGLGGRRPLSLFSKKL